MATQYAAFCLSLSVAPRVKGQAQCLGSCLRPPPPGTTLNSFVIRRLDWLPRRMTTVQVTAPPEKVQVIRI